MFFKIGVLENFENFSRVGVFIKKRLQHRYFPVNFAKFLHLFLQNTFGGYFLLSFSNFHEIFRIIPAQRQILVTSWKFVNAKLIYRKTDLLKN